jgi:hypothetical protein
MMEATFGDQGIDGRTNNEMILKDTGNENRD